MLLFFYMNWNHRLILIVYAIIFLSLHFVACLYFDFSYYMPWILINSEPVSSWLDTTRDAMIRQLSSQIMSLLWKITLLNWISKYMCVFSVFSEDFRFLSFFYYYIRLFFIRKDFVLLRKRLGHVLTTSHRKEPVLYYGLLNRDLRSKVKR